MGRRSVEGIEIKASTDNENLYIVNNPKITNVYSVYLTTEIGESKNYRDLYNMLRESGEEEHFIIYMSNFGGYLHTGLEIINAMKASHGQIYTCLTGGCYSMAPLIALAGQKVYVEEDSFMMFHDYSGGTMGKGNEQVAAIQHEKPHFDNMFKKITKGFLKVSETNNILRGHDLYLGTNDVINRLKRIKKLGNGSDGK